MTPEQQTQFDTMQRQVTYLLGVIDDLAKWKEDRIRQQITSPLDDVSKANIGAAVGHGAGSVALTQSVSVPTAPTTISVPAAYAGTRVIEIEGQQYTIPYL